MPAGRAGFALAGPVYEPEHELAYGIKIVRLATLDKQEIDTLTTRAIRIAESQDRQEDETEPVQQVHGGATTGPEPKTRRASSARVLGVARGRRRGAFHGVPEAGVEDVEDGLVQVRLLLVGQEG